MVRARRKKRLNGDFIFALTAKRRDKIGGRRRNTLSRVCMLFYRGRAALMVSTADQRLIILSTLPTAGLVCSPVSRSNKLVIS